MRFGLASGKVIIQAMDGFSDPQKVLDAFGLMEGMVVADFGVGSGFYSLSAAKKVGEAGRVYAVDIQNDLLLRLQKQAEKDGLDNIKTVWADLERGNGGALQSESADAVLVANILFQVENKPVFLREVSRILKKKGRALAVDWADSFGDLGPRPDKVVTRDRALRLFNDAGFAHDRDVKAGEHHWGMVLKKSNGNGRNRAPCGKITKMAR